MRWEVEWLVDRSEEPASIPAYRFLKSLPVNVRVQPTFTRCATSRGRCSIACSCFGNASSAVW